VDSPDVDDAQDLSAESEGSQYDPGSEPSIEEESDHQMEEQYQHVRPARERNFKDKLRIEMSKRGLYQEYSFQKCRPEERAAMKQGVEMMATFKAWSAKCGDITSKRFKNPLGCAQKVVFFLLEGTAYKWSNLQSAVRAKLFFDPCDEAGMQPST
jgi:hypothetical protein